MRDEKSKRQLRDESRLREYKTHRSRVGEALLRATLRALASVDAADTVNSLLENRFNLKGVSIETGEVDLRVKSILRAEIASILVSHSTLPARRRRIMADRIVAQMIPLRDGPSQRYNAAPQPRMRVEDIESVIAREAKKLT